jgi:hypothetical protein
MIGVRRKKGKEAAKDTRKQDERVAGCAAGQRRSEAVKKPPGRTAMVADELQSPRSRPVHERSDLNAWKPLFFILEDPEDA